MRCLSALICLVLALGAAGQQEDKQFTCTGKVVDADGKPLAGVAVEAYRLSYRQSCLPQALPAGTVTTGVDGGFSFNMDLDASELALLLAHKPGLALGFGNPRRGEGGPLTIELGPPAVLAGTVVDESGKPVAGAAVSASLSVRSGRPCWARGYEAIGRLIRKTDQHGRFSFNDVPSTAQADLVVTAPGWGRVDTFRPDIGEMSFAAGKTDIRIVLAREARIEGRVVQKGTSKPASGVRLFARPEPRRGTYDFALAVSGADGSFRLTGLRAGDYVLEVAGTPEAPAEWVGLPVKIATEAGKAVTGATIEVSRGGMLELAVTNEQGGPIEDVHVYIVRRAPRLQIGARSGKDGLARIRLAPGSYQLQSASKWPEYGSRRGGETIEIAEGKTRRMQIRLPPAPSVTGTVRDPAGKPAPGAEVRLLPMSVRPGTSGPDGRFKASFLPREFVDPSESVPCYLVARHLERNLAAAVEIAPDTKAADVKLAPGRTLVGKVVDPEGKPIPGAAVNVQLWAERWASSITMPLYTDGEGRYELSALPGGLEYAITITAPGHGQADPRLYVPEKGSRRVEAETVVLGVADQSISGIVVDESGKGIAGTDVNVHGDGQRYRRAATDSAGKFTVDGLCKGQVEASVYVQERRLHARVNTEVPAKDVKIVVSDQAQSAGGRAPERKPAAPLLGEPLPALATLQIDPGKLGISAKGKPILVCFWDYQQRPSRRCVRMLAAKGEELKKNGVVVLSVHASPADAGELAEWVKRLKVSFPVGTVPPEAKQREKLLRDWGVGGLPWLILADGKHVVRAEGFALAELEHKLKAVEAVEP